MLGRDEHDVTSLKLGSRCPVRAKDVPRLEKAAHQPLAVVGCAGSEFQTCSKSCRHDPNHSNTTRMKPIFAFFLSLAVAVGACAPTGQPTVPTNTIASAESAAQTATTVVSDAQAVWPIVYAFLPTAQQSVAQDAFNKAIFTANHAILALNDAIQVAIAANNPNPDLGTVISQVTDAVAQLVAIVQGTNAGPTLQVRARTASGVDAMVDMQTAADRLKALKR